MLIFPFINASKRVVFLMIVLTASVATLKSYIRYQEHETQLKEYKEIVAKEGKGQALTDKEKATKESWQSKYTKPDKKKIEGMLKEKKGSYWDIFLSSIPTTKWYETTLVYEFLIWDMLYMTLLGIFLFKIDFFDPEIPTRNLIARAVIFYGIGLPLVYWLDQRLFSNNYVTADWALFQIFYPIERIVLTLAHVLTVLVLLRIKFFSWVGNLLGMAGQLALTNYLLQSFLGLILFSGFGFDLFGKLSLSELMIVVGGIWFFEITLSWFWLRYFNFGPAEWLWRSLASWKWQALKKSQKF